MAATAYLAWLTKSGQAKFLAFECVTEEDQDITAKATEAPVEEGATVSDHVIVENPKVSLEVLISQTPIEDVNNRGMRKMSVPLEVKFYQPPLNPLNPLGAVAGAISSLFNGQQSYAATVYGFDEEIDFVAENQEVLDKLHSDRQLVTVHTSSRVYKDMWLAHYQLHGNAGTGLGRTLRLDFQQIKKVTVSIVAAPKPTEVRATPAVKKGDKGGKEEEKPDTKSVLKALLGDKLVFNRGK